MNKWIILIVISCFSCYCGVFTLACSYYTKDIYTYQVGVYKEKVNMEDMMGWLKQNGYDGYYYEKDDMYYVLSLISESYDEVLSHSTHIKGVIKKYEVNQSLSDKELIHYLKNN